MCGAHHDHVGGNERCGVESDDGADEVEILIVVLFQINDAFLAERLDQMAGLRRQCNQPISRRNENDPLIGAVGTGPIRNSAPGAFPFTLTSSSGPFVAILAPAFSLRNQFSSENSPSSFT